MIEIAVTESSRQAQTGKEPRIELQSRIAIDDE